MEKTIIFFGNEDSVIVNGKLEEIVKQIETCILKISNFGTGIVGLETDYLGTIYLDVRKIQMICKHKE